MLTTLEYYSSMAEMLVALKGPIETLQGRLRDWQASARAYTAALEPEAESLTSEYTPFWNPDGPPRDLLPPLQACGDFNDTNNENVPANIVPSASTGIFWIFTKLFFVGF